MFGTLFNVLKIAQLHVYKMKNIKQTLHVKKLLMDYLKLYIEFYLRVSGVPINQFEILLSIIQYLKLQWMSTKLTSFKKLCPGLLKLSNVLLWYEMVKKKNMKYCTKNNKHCYAYRVLLANTNTSFSFSLLTRSNTGFQIKKRKKNFSKMVHLDAKKKINKYT